jgi:hypothetical protein
MKMLLRTLCTFSMAFLASGSRFTKSLYSALRESSSLC